MIPPKAKKKVIKRRKKGTGPSKMYFGPDTQDSIVDHKNLENDVFQLDSLIYVLEKNEFEEIIEDWIIKEKDKEVLRIKKLEKANLRAEQDEELKVVEIIPIDVNEKFVIGKYLPVDYESFLEVPKNREESLALAIERRTKIKASKDDLYTKSIQPAFDKLVENLIFLYGFMGLHDSYEDLKSDCVTSLYSSISKFDETRGFKAFSYFNIVAKNFLIIKTKKRSSKIKLHLSFDDEDAMGFVEIESLRQHCTLPSIDDVLIDGEFITRISTILGEIKQKLKKDAEIRCMDSIISIFNTIDDIDMLNKRAVFHLIREQSGLNPKQLTTTMSIIKKHYRELKKNHEFGIFKQ